MSFRRKPVCYRINRGECQQGYQPVDCDTPNEVYAAPEGGAAIVGAVVTPCGDCPAEVVVVAAAAAAERDTTTSSVPILDCAGTTTQTAEVLNVVQTVPHPTAVQRVMICPSDSEFDREVAVWCHLDTGETVTVVTHWPVNAPPGTPPVVETYTAAGAVWAGDRTKLAKCASGADVELVDQAVCSGGVNYVRTTFFKTSDQSVLATVWQDAAGDVVAPPAGAVTLGACPVVNPVKVAWLRLENFVWRGEGARPMPSATGDSLTALLGPLLSITIKQVRGQGFVIGAARPTGAMIVDAGETWSWSSHGSDQEDTLDPAFTLDSNGGLMRVIVTYRAP